MLADVDQMCAAIKDLFNDTRVVAEPSGALAVAGMKIFAARHKLKRKNTRCYKYRCKYKF